MRVAHRRSGHLSGLSSARTRRRKGGAQASGDRALQTNRRAEERQRQEASRTRPSRIPPIRRDLRLARPDEHAGGDERECRHCDRRAYKPGARLRAVAAEAR